jgi:hypothetical protein
MKIITTNKKSINLDSFASVYAYNELLKLLKTPSKVIIT